MMPLAVCAALFSLGRKYDIKPLHKEARRRLFNRFPLTLRENDVDNAWHGLESVGEDDCYHLLLIARRTGLISILPQVLYECRENYGACEINSGWRSQASEEDMAGNIVGQFNDKDARILLAGSIAINEACVETTYSWLYGPGTLYATCKTPKHCHAGREKALRSFRRKGASVPSPSDQWMLFPFMYTQDGLCTDCSKLARDEHEAGREKFWQRLPSLFGLPSWTELAKEREEMYVLNHVNIEVFSSYYLCRE